MTGMDENRLKFINRFEELAELMMDPTFLSDQERYTAAAKEYSDLEPIVTALKGQEKAREELEGAYDLFRESELDGELRELARAEIKDLELQIEEFENNIQTLMMPTDPRDSKRIMVEIRPGAGGEEAALFAAVLLKMYQAYAERQGLDFAIIDISETGIGGIKEAIFEVEGKGAYSLYKYESGVHRVQRVPVTESGGRIHTSTCTVAVMPEAEEVEIDINPADLQIDTYRASGAGGQHVNKTSSAIRITHIPTNTVVTCQDERSQHKNKDKAMRVLRTRLLHAKEEEAKAEEASLRKNQVGTGDRSERIRTYNYHQSRVSDHRIGLTLYRMEEILAGDLDELVEKLREAERSEQLE